MYQDRTDKNRTIIVIQRDDVIETYSVDNKDLVNKNFVDKFVEENYEDKGSKEKK